MRALREPTTIVARPSALACTRLTWCLAAALVTVTVLPRAGAVAPWLFAPLVVSAAVTGGAWSAAVWALAGGLLLDLMPPVTGHAGASALPALAAAVVAARLSPSWSYAWWVPGVTGAVAALVVTGSACLMNAASTGKVALDPAFLLGSTLTTALLTALVAPRWVRWARREQERGRA